MRYLQELAARYKRHAVRAADAAASATKRKPRRIGRKRTTSYGKRYYESAALNVEWLMLRNSARV